MKNKILAIALIVSAIFISCNNDYDAPNSNSDLGWYTSALRETEWKVGINKYMSFSDLSQGTIDHKWTISEGNYFLKGPIERLDSVFDQFIVNRGATETTDKTIHVLFKKSGQQDIRLYNTFKDSVAFRGNDTIPAVKMGDKWVMDTTFVVDVYDTIVPAIEIRRGEDILPHENPLDTIYIEAGNSLEFTDVTVIGRPDTWKWSVGGSTSTEQVATLVFKKLGNWKGSVQLSRTAENTPGDWENYQIPVNFKVIPSSQPFQLFGDVAELENETIQLPFNGEFTSFENKEAFFKVNVNGMDFSITSVEINENDSTILDIVLDDPIYRPDVITVSLLDGSGITSTDNRPVVSFNNEAVVMHDVNLWNPTESSFEDGPSGVWQQDQGPNGSVEYSTEQAYDGSYSLKISSTTDAFVRATGAMSLGNFEAGVEYKFTWKVYIDPITTAPSMGPWFYWQQNADTPLGDQQFWNGLNGKPRETWITQERIFTVPANSEGYMTVRINNTATIYIDAFHVVKHEERP